jgi:hypothetical protein
VQPLTVLNNGSLVEEPEDTQSLPAAALGASGSADVEKESDSKDNSDED